jgi:hypothetical protein
MFEKIISWITLGLTVWCLIYWLTDTAQDMWLFVFVYFSMIAYVNIRYIERLNKDK